MPYFCKKCGAAVSGKYCSCCGTRVTDDFTDFRKAQRRMNREARDAAQADKRFVAKDRYFASSLAMLTLDIAFDRLLPGHALHVDYFDRHSEYCWKKLPECRELGELLYERAVDALILNKADT